MKNISNGTIARTIVLILALVNQVLAIAGRGTIDIADDTIYQLCTLGATLITALAAWWKNNSFTAAAIAGDDTKRAAKLGIENIDAEIGTDRQEAESDDDDNGYSKEEE